jgi:hypothetical protein
MIEIPEQESVFSCSRMWIDSASATEVGTTLAGFGLLLFLLLFLGMTGPAPVSVQTVERPFANSSAKRFTFDLGPFCRSIGS